MQSANNLLWAAMVLDSHKPEDRVLCPHLLVQLSPCTQAWPEARTVGVAGAQSSSCKQQPLLSLAAMTST